MGVRDPRPYAKAYVDQPYCYGTRGWRMTASNIAAKKKQYPSMAKYIPCEGGANSKNIGLDCIGLVCAACSVPDTQGGPMGYSDTGMGYYQAKNGKSGNAFMDAVSAEGARLTWGAKPISSIPEPTKAKPGIAVFIASKSGQPGHIGIYLGNGNVIESTPPRVQITKLKARRSTGGSTKQWDSWAYIPEKWLTWADSYFGVSDTTAPEKPATGQPEDVRTMSLADLRLMPGDKVWIKPEATHYWPDGPVIPTAKWLRGPPDKPMLIAIDTISTDGKTVNYKGGAPTVRLGYTDTGALVWTWCSTENLVKVEE